MGLFQVLTKPSSSSDIIGPKVSSLPTQEKITSASTSGRLFSLTVLELSITVSITSKSGGNEKRKVVPSGNGCPHITARDSLFKKSVGIIAALLPIRLTCKGYVLFSFTILPSS